jgi:HK97 gp10 family phage protein
MEMAESSVKFKFVGGEEFLELLNEIKDDYGEKDAKKILTSAVKDAMNPVLMMAKALAPKDTGALEASLRVEARRPTFKDKRSRYIQNTDTIIGTVTTAPGNVLKNRSFHNLHAPAGQRIKQIGIPSDARANVQEFGSYKMAAHPFMRPALESRSMLAVNILGDALGKRLEKYKAKQYRKGNI